MGVESGFVIVAILAVQLLGLASVAATRMHQECRTLPLWQSLFFLFLLLVGAAACVTLVAGSTLWLTCGATFACMVLGAVFDPCRASNEVML